MRNAIDMIETAYGRLSTAALHDARNSYDVSGLLRCAEEMGEVSQYLGSEYGLRDAMARLYCMAATVLCGSSAVLPPDDGALRALLSDVREDLTDAVAFFDSCIELIGPLEKLLGDEARPASR